MTVWRTEVEGIPADAPCLDGHFPGNPIVPGAVLLGYAASALAERGEAIASVSRMKFLCPLLPEQAFAIEVDGRKIKWLAGGNTVAQARLTLKAI